MTKVVVEYKGDLESTLTHEPSHTVIYTDAPKDAGGQARTFSPTDLIAAALASCITTTLGIYAKRKELNIQGLKIEIEKEMSPAPERRILRLTLQVWMPMDLPVEQRHRWEDIAHSCPVHRCLHPGIEVNTHFHWLKVNGLP